jgi:membrane-associated protease RseP (regulator of RpoE activity)
MQDKVSYAAPPVEALERFSLSNIYAQRYPLHLLLFGLTVLSTLFWGAYWMVLHETRGAAIGPLQFLSQLFRTPDLLYKGLSYSATIMIILLSHEMGHYLACRYYGIRATLPFFIPAPIVGTGTFGAFIRIRSPFPDKKSLFDVGVAGPLAGFFIALPFLYFGLKHSIQIPMTQVQPGQGYFGEPIIFRIFASFLFPKDYNIILHPMGFAVWFACLATSINLLPIAQLDGGHVSYALFGKHAYLITWIFFFGIFGLAINGFLHSWISGIQWLIYIVLLLVLKKIAGFRHPPTMDDQAPVGFGRKLVGALALLVFILTFMPVTIDL